MGTRSITNIHEMDELGGEIVCTFYRHWDGSVTGHGKDLIKWLSDKKLVNGIGSDFVEGRDFNRAGTMAVKLMYYIQEKSGCEVVPTGTEDQWVDYIYDIFFIDSTFIVYVEDVHKEKKLTMIVK